jgi:hypothetical protein
VALRNGAAERALVAGNDSLLIGREWEAGLEAMRELESACARRTDGAGGDSGWGGVSGPALRAALARARRRAKAAWIVHSGLAPDPVALSRMERSAFGPGDSKVLIRLHRIAVRLSVDPRTLPRDGWLWVIPEGFSPYVRLADWIPPAGKRRFCQEVRWVSEAPSRGEIEGLVRGLRGEKRPVLFATLLRGWPSLDKQEAMRPLIEFSGLSVVAHLLDEAWPGELGKPTAEWPAPGGNSGRVERDSRRPALALTSGPSKESLTGLASALDLPDGRWRRGEDGLHFPIDS